MQYITNAITNLAMIETTNAKQIHGTTYASNHEAFGVLAEEVQEADDDLGDVKRYMEHLCGMCAAMMCPAYATH